MTKEGIRSGFRREDILYLNKQTDLPKTQIFSTEEIIEDPEQEQFWCATCKGKLDHIKKMQMWTCTACVEYYYPDTQTTSLKDITDSKLRPYSGLMHYPTMDADDIPFVKAINLDTQQEEGLENHAYEDRRVQKIHVQGSFLDAIHAGMLSAKKKDGDNDV